MLDHSGASYQNPSYTSPDGFQANYQRLRGDIRQNLPSEAEAYQLLETVIFYIGQSQSHFDPREVSNDIDAYYINENGLPFSGSPRLLIMVLLFAIGKLFSSDHQENVNNSYSRSLFEYVHERIAVPSEQFAQGRPYVEMLALIAVYLQNVNRREEAYIYVSSTSLRPGSRTRMNNIEPDQFSITSRGCAWIPPPTQREARHAVGEGSYEQAVVDGLHARKVCPQITMKYCLEIL